MVRCTILAYLHNNEQNFSRTVAQNCCTDRHLECVFKMSLESLMRVPQDWPILGHVTVASHGKLPVHMPVPGRGGYFAYLCHMIDKELVVFSFLYIKLFELGVEVAFNIEQTNTRLPTTNLNCPDFHFPPPQLWAHRWCFCAAHLLLRLSLPGTPRHCLSTGQILKYIQSAYPHWLRPRAHPLVACPRNDFRRKTLDRACTVPLDFFWLVSPPLYLVPSPPAHPCCRFRSLRNSSRRHSALMLLSLSSVTNLSLIFCFCAACTMSYRCLQVGSRNCRCHFFATCTVIRLCLGRQTVSDLTSGLLRYSAKPTPCWLHLAYFGQKTGCWPISCPGHRHPQSPPSLPWDFFVTQIFP